MRMTATTFSLAMAVGGRVCGGAENNRPVGPSARHPTRTGARLATRRFIDLIESDL